MKRISILITLACVVTAAAAQTSSDHLLWYKGKLLKPNVLLTKSGDTVLYNPQKRIVKVVSKTGTGRQFDKVMSELNNTQKRIDATVQQITKSVPRHLRTSFSNAVTSAYATVEAEWKPSLSNTITLPQGEPVFARQGGIFVGKGGYSNIDDDLYLNEESRYEEVLKKFRAYMEKHKEDNLGLLPVPPRYNFSYCYPCDSQANERYENEVAKFKAEVSAVDVDIMNEALQFSAYLQRNTSMGPNEQAADNEVWNMIQFLMSRGAKRAALLLDKYKNDAERLPAILQYVLPVHRQLQLMGEESNPTALTGLDYYEPIFQTLHNHFVRAMREKDYAIGLNIHFILKLERERQLLGLYITGDANLLEQYLTFNQFKLNSNITAKLGNDNGYVAGHVRGDNWFYALPEQSTCRLNWIIASDKVDRTASYKLLQAELVGAPVEYVGTKEWQSQPPIIKIDFCHKEGEEIPDTIRAATFHPEGFRERWKYPDPTGVIEVEQVSGILMVCFIDMKKAKKDAELLNKEMIEKKKQEMQAKFAKLGPGNITADMGLKMQAEMEKLNKEIQEMILKTNPVSYLFEPTVNNRSNEILKERLDGKEIFPEMAAIDYAYFHLTLEHDPNGSKRIPSMQALMSIK